LGFLGLAFLLYLWMRPRRRDVFWDVNNVGRGRAFAQRPRSTALDRDLHAPARR
jgi:hypothetical protein